MIQVQKSDKQAISYSAKITSQVLQKGIAKSLI